MAVIYSGERSVEQAVVTVYSVNNTCPISDASDINGGIVSMDT